MVLSERKSTMGTYSSLHSLALVILSDINVAIASLPHTGHVKKVGNNRFGRIPKYLGWKSDLIDVPFRANIRRIGILVPCRAGSERFSILSLPFSPWVEVPIVAERYALNPPVVFIE